MALVMIRQGILQWVPYLLVVLFAIPYIIPPLAVEDFRIALLLNQYCQQEPAACQLLLRGHYPLKVTLFNHYDMIYIRPKVVELWDNTILTIIGYVIHHLVSSGDISFALETVQIGFATSYTVGLMMIRMALVARVWMLFVVGFASTVIHMWLVVVIPTIAVLDMWRLVT